MADDHAPPALPTMSATVSLDGFAARGVLVPANASTLEFDMTLAIKRRHLLGYKTEVAGGQLRHLSGCSEAGQ